MPNYLVSYQIEDSVSQKSIENFLNDLGLSIPVSVSVRYGKVRFNKETLLKRIALARKRFGIRDTDLINLYYPEMNKDHYLTIGQTVV